MKVLFSLLTIIVQLINVHSNPCRWLDNGVGCVIRCMEGEGGSSYSISGQIQTVYDELPECHSTGIKLILPKDVTGYALRPNWLLVDINLLELEIDAGFVSEFNENVFASNVFAKVKKLNLKNILLFLSWEESIRKSVLVGLESLEELMITNSAVKIYDSGWLDNVNGTIKSLLLAGMGEETSFEIERLTGGSARFLSNVEEVQIHYNLTKLNYRSFTAIPNVRELDLSDCRISFIEERSFEKIGIQLQKLNLERNLLTTLPADIFGSFHLLSTKTTLFELTSLVIHLSDNPWHCNCSMDHLKTLLIDTENFAGNILCKTPVEIEDYPIKETEFCPLPITTDTTSTTPESTTVPIDDRDEIEKECSSNDNANKKTKISIQPQMQRFRLNATLDGGVFVTLEKYTLDLILIWFESDKHTKDSEQQQKLIESTNCFANMSDPIRVNGLKEDINYSFCLMNISQQTVSPFDCISYYHKGHVVDESIDVWLYNNSRPLIISLIVIACLVNLVIGLIFGAIILKWRGYEFSLRLVFPRWKNEERHEAIDPYYISGWKNGQHNDLPPPLPPHPLRDVDDQESYYSTIKHCT